MSFTEKFLVGVLAAAAIALCTPMIAWLGAAGADWFGLPAPLVWSLVWLALTFGALVAAYWNDAEQEPTSSAALSERAGDTAGESR